MVLSILGADNQEDFIYSLIYAMSMILVYIFAGNYIEKKEPIIGHETTIVIVLSLIVTELALLSGHAEIIDKL